MIVLQFFQDLLHYRFAEQNGLGVDLKKAAILGNGCHFTVIQIDDLPVLSDHGSLFPAQKVRRYIQNCLFSSQIL